MSYEGDGRRSRDDQLVEGGEVAERISLCAVRVVAASAHRAG
jgi:hypothetical protein